TGAVAEHDPQISSVGEEQPQPLPIVAPPGRLDRVLDKRQCFREAAGLILDEHRSVVRDPAEHAHTPNARRVALGVVPPTTRTYAIRREISGPVAEQLSGLGRRPPVLGIDLTPEGILQAPRGVSLTRPEARQGLSEHDLPTINITWVHQPFGAGVVASGGCVVVHGVRPAAGCDERSASAIDRFGCRVADLLP